jgi:hypothetical protein
VKRHEVDTAATTEQMGFVDGVLAKLKGMKRLWV